MNIKKLSWIFFLVFLSGCMSHEFTIPESQLRKEVKTVLVLPVYIDPQFVPNDFPKDAGFQPSSSESEQYARVSAGQSEFITRAMTQILKEGRYNFKTVAGNASDLSASGVERRKSTVLSGGNPNGLSYYFAAKPEYIQSLARKYNVDAVFFHAIPVYFDSGYEFAVSSGVVNLPTYRLMYEPLIYDKEGNLIFNDKFAILSLSTLNKAQAVTQAEHDRNNYYQSVKASPVEVKQSLGKVELRDHIIQSASEENISVVSSLCGNLIQCRMIYNSVPEKQN